MTGTSVGAAILAARQRAHEVRQSSPRKVRVRLLTEFADNEGLTVVARISARHGGELEAQVGKGSRCIPWEALDARAGELPGLVDEVVAEIEAAVLAAIPPVQTPASIESDRDQEAFEALVDTAGEQMTKVAQAVFSDPRARRLSKASLLEVVSVGAFQVGALAGFAGGQGPDELQEMLNGEISRVRQRAGEGQLPIDKLRYDA